MYKYLVCVNIPICDFSFSLVPSQATIIPLSLREVSQCQSIVMVGTATAAEAVAAAAGAAAAGLGVGPP